MAIAEVWSWINLISSGRFYLYANWNCQEYLTVLFNWNVMYKFGYIARSVWMCLYPNVMHMNYRCDSTDKCFLYVQVTGWLPTSTCCRNEWNEYVAWHFSYHCKFECYHMGLDGLLLSVSINWVVELKMLLDSYLQMYEMCHATE